METLRTSVDSLFTCLGTQPSKTCDFHGHVQCFLYHRQIFIIFVFLFPHYTADHTPPFGLVCVERPTGENELHSATLADDFGQPLCAPTAWYHSQGNLRLAKSCGRRCENNVAPVKALRTHERGSL